MSLRESNVENAGQELKPDAAKSDGERVADTANSLLDDAASYLPGQSEPRDALSDNARDPHPTHDTGRQGGGSVTNALKPSGDQSVVEQLQQKADEAMSHVEPNSEKGLGQQVKDTITPGNDSSVTPHNDGHGVMDSVAAAVESAKDTVAGFFSGDDSGKDH